MQFAITYKMVSTDDETWVARQSGPLNSPEIEINMKAFGDLTETQKRFVLGHEAMHAIARSIFKPA